MLSTGLRYRTRVGGTPRFIAGQVQPSILVRYGIYLTSNVEYKPPQGGETASLVREFIKEEWKAAIKEATRVAEQIFQKLVWGKT
jgi:hypothetical protein